MRVGSGTTAGAAVLFIVAIVDVVDVAAVVMAADGRKRDEESLLSSTETGAAVEERDMVDGVVVLSNTIRGANGFCVNFRFCFVLSKKFVCSPDSFTRRTMGSTRYEDFVLDVSIPSQPPK
jgi:hypothetical protein